MAHCLIAVAGAAAGAAYLDAKLHISKDLNSLSRAKKGEENFARAVKEKKASGIFLFERAAHKLQNAPCVWSRQGEHTWSQAYARVCQYGHYFQSLGVKSTQHVGVYLYNSPDLLFIWLGLLSIGAAPALINYNLGREALLHCVRLSGTSLLIYDDAPDCAARIGAVESQLGDLQVKAIMLSDDLKNSLGGFPSDRPQTDCFDQTAAVLPFALMYTSGTTGLPKAFPLTVARNYPSASLLPKTFGQQPGVGGDRSYYCIPLYHGTGGIAAMNDLMSGISIAVAPKFSLSGFWKDCIDSRSTIFVYVGELVRYLLSAPAAETDRKHKIRLIWGNGLSPELWELFQKRFGVGEIGEFFASTEGVLTLVNHYRSGYGLGAVGHHGWLLRRKFHDSYIPVKIDHETGDVWRSPVTGFAQRVPYEVGGEVIVKLPSRSSWAGYWRSEEATGKKLMENVFEKGDLYVRTGDALRRDADGHWYFMDRLGDTYRWKGENVSTTEVSQILGTHPQIAEANVYGVTVPSHDGKAGCAAIIFKTTAHMASFDWTALAAMLRAELPSHAVPIFIRVLEGGLVGKMSTDNLKHNKVHLREEGVDPGLRGSKVTGGQGDKLYWLPAGSETYLPFTVSDWDRLSHARARI